MLTACTEGANPSKREKSETESGDHIKTGKPRRNVIRKRVNDLAAGQREREDNKDREMLGVWERGWLVGLGPTTVRLLS